jgi:hypothetical protein
VPHRALLPAGLPIVLMLVLICSDGPYAFTEAAVHYIR